MEKHMGKNKDVQQLLRKAKKAGLAIERSKNGHWRISLSDNTHDFVVVAYSPNTDRAVRNACRDVDRLIMKGVQEWKANTNSN